MFFTKNLNILGPFPKFVPVICIIWHSHFICFRRNWDNKVKRHSTVCAPLYWQIEYTQALQWTIIITETDCSCSIMKPYWLFAKKRRRGKKKRRQTSFSFQSKFLLLCYTSLWIRFVIILVHKYSDDVSIYCLIRFFVLYINPIAAKQIKYIYTCTNNI